MGVFCSAKCNYDSPCLKSKYGRHVMKDVRMNSECKSGDGLFGGGLVDEITSNHPSSHVLNQHTGAVSVQMSLDP